MRCREHVGSDVKFLCVVAFIVWVLALVIFCQRTTDWSTSPAFSRNLNEPCILFNFFDWHDLWHLLSSLALLLSFYVSRLLLNSSHFAASLKLLNF